MTDEDAAMRSKLAKQRNELARLTKLVKELSEDKRMLQHDVERLRKLLEWRDRTNG